MNTRRSIFVAAAVAGLVALVVPAAGQGQAAGGSLKWLASGGHAITSYDFGTLPLGSRASTRFRLRYAGQTKSGKLSVHLDGSSAFSIASDGCKGKSIGPKLSCWVSVAYTAGHAGAGDSATLWAHGGHGSFSPNLGLSGRCSDGKGSDHVFWATYGKSGTGEDSAINGVPLNGGCVTALARTNPYALVVDGTHAYWTDYVGVRTAPLGGGPATTLASGQYPASIAVDGTHVYWVYDGTVNAVPVGGGSVTTLASGLASGQSYPNKVAVDGAHVYWTTYGAQGTVNEVPIGGGTVTTLAGGQSYPLSLAVDGEHVYWADDGDAGDGKVNEVPVGGGTVTTLAGGQHDPVSLALGP